MAVYHSGMNPTIAGALTGGGFAVVGFAASTWAATVTMHANRREALDQRLWEKRTILYEHRLVFTRQGRPDLEQMGR
jgi:hypothetical protein